MHKENVYEPIPAKVEEIIEETPTIKTFTLVPEEEIEFQSGQFMQLTLPGVGEAPFTPSSSPYVKDKMDITILRTGKVTDKLHEEVEVGDTLYVRGPLGKGYPIKKLPGKEILIVGGGVGLAPLRALIYGLFGMLDDVERVSIKYGARTPDELLFRRLYDDWASKPKVDFTPTIDNPHPDWDGRTGVVTVLLEDLDIDLSNSLVFSCGPSIMLKFVTYKCLDVGFKPEQIYLSMNRRMSCGIGKCGRCNIGPYYLCVDGPDMNYAKIMDYDNVF